MKFENHNEITAQFQQLELLAHQIVEGFISGMHKSPFHGFSAEFAEHKLYNKGESTKHIDWKLFAKSDRLYTKTYEEETNLRCHIIIDNSSSMHYPLLHKDEAFYKNKIGFSVLASAVLMKLLKKQRDAVGLSIFAENYEYYAPEKGSDRHHVMLLNQLEQILSKNSNSKKTDTVTFLHQVAEKLHRRSMIILFTDMLQHEDETKLFNALQHLKHNKHKVVVFHVMDKSTEQDLIFDTTPRKFVDIETGQQIDAYVDNLQENYQKEVGSYIKRIQNACLQYKINLIPIDIKENFEKILTTYLIEKQKFG